MGLFSKFKGNSTDWKDIKDRIYPWVKAKSAGQGSESGVVVQVDIPTVPLVGDLFALFVVDRGDVVDIVQKSMIPEGMTAEELYEIARKNLVRDVKFNIVQNEESGYYGILAGGNYEACALCLDYVWEYFVNNIGENLVVAVPAKDMILIAGESNVNAIQAIKELTSEIYKSGENPLTNQMFSYDKATKKFAVL